MVATTPQILRIEVAAVVPDSLRDQVAAAHARGAQVVVALCPPEHLSDPEVRAGWEIGVLTQARACGVDQVEGADPRRWARVQAVARAIDAHRTPAGQS